MSKNNKKSNKKNKKGKLVSSPSKAEAKTKKQKTHPARNLKDVDKKVIPPEYIIDESLRSRTRIVGMTREEAEREAQKHASLAGLGDIRAKAKEAAAVTPTVKHIPSDIEEGPIPLKPDQIPGAMKSSSSNDTVYGQPVLKKVSNAGSIGLILSIAVIALVLLSVLLSGVVSLYGTLTGTEVTTTEEQRESDEAVVANDSEVAIPEETKESEEKEPSLEATTEETSTIDTEEKLDIPVSEEEAPVDNTPAIESEVAQRTSLEPEEIEYSATADVYGYQLKADMKENSALIYYPISIVTDKDISDFISYLDKKYPLYASSVSFKALSDGLVEATYPPFTSKGEMSSFFDSFILELEAYISQLPQVEEEVESVHTEVTASPVLETYHGEAEVYNYHITADMGATSAHFTYPKNVISSNDIDDFSKAIFSRYPLLGSLVTYVNSNDGSLVITYPYIETKEEMKAYFDSFISALKSYIESREKVEVTPVKVNTPPKTPLFVIAPVDESKEEESSTSTPTLIEDKVEEEEIIRPKNRLSLYASPYTFTYANESSTYGFGFDLSYERMLSNAIYAGLDLTYTGSKMQSNRFLNDLTVFALLTLNKEFDNNGINTTFGVGTDVIDFTFSPAVKLSLCYYHKFNRSASFSIKVEGKAMYKNSSILYSVSPMVGLVINF